MTTTTTALPKVTELRPTGKHSAKGSKVHDQLGTTPTVKTSTSPVDPTHDIPEMVDPLLVNILAKPRKHGSPSELEFCGWLTDYLSKTLMQPVSVHSEGAMSVTLPVMRDGQPSPDPSTTLFSCHVDTVDWRDNEVGVRKELAYDPNFGHICLAKDSKGTCLGADDGAGIWIMLKMIEAGVPGTYLFHRGEECGGVSAKAIAQKERPWLSGFEIAAAFDRPRCNEIITHQGGAECASTKFAMALCERLNSEGMGYFPSSAGVYTDTKEYRRIVHECINIGVGYQAQHGMTEFLDYAHLCALLKAVCAIDWESLPIDRDASKAVDPVPAYRGSYGNHTGFGRNWRDDDDDDSWGVPAPGQRALPGMGNGTKAKGAIKKAKPKHGPADATPAELVAEVRELSIDALVELVCDDPETAAKVLVQLMRDVNKLEADVDFLQRYVGGAL